jgi:hypothetical protein
MNDRITDERLAELLDFEDGLANEPYIVGERRRYKADVASALRELAELRETNRRLNARCQQAESALPDYRKIIAVPPDGDGVRFVSGSLGRALAVSMCAKLEDEVASLREQAGKLPKEPPLGLLVSMALRQDHGLGVPGYYDSQFFGGTNPSHKQRMESAVRSMRQLYEEVSGHGFWSPENDCEYVARYQAAIGPLPGGDA